MFLYYFIINGYLIASNDVNIKITIGADTYEIKAARKDVNELGKSLSNTDTIANALKGSFGKIAVSLGLLTGAAIKIKDMVKSGIEANRVYENLKIQLTGLIAANASNISSLGNALNAQQKWSLGLKQSENILKELNVTNQKTKFSLSEIVESFNMFYATSAKGGDKNKAVLAMDSIALAAQAVGKDLKALTPMMDSLATGTVVAASEMGSFMKITGLTNEELKKANQSGKLYEYLIDKLANFKELSNEAAKSYDVAFGGLKSELSDISKELSRPMFDSITTNIISFTNFIKDNKDAMVEYGSNIVELTKHLGIFGASFAVAKLSLVGFSMVTSGSIKTMELLSLGIDRARLSITAIKTAFKSFLPTAIIFTAYEAIMYFVGGLNKAEKAADTLNNTLSKTNDEIKAMSVNQREYAMLELKNTYNTLQSEYTTLERKIRVGTLGIFKPSDDELIKAKAQLDEYAIKMKQTTEQIERIKNADKLIASESLVSEVKKDNFYENVSEKFGKITTVRTLKKKSLAK